MDAPTTPILDWGLDETLSSNWSILSGIGIFPSPSGFLLISSVNGSYWNQIQTRNFDVYATIISTTVSGVWGVCGRIVQPGTSTWDGYLWEYEEALHVATLYRVNNGSRISLGSKSLTLSTGDVLLLQGRDTWLTGSARLSGVWTGIMTVSNGVVPSGQIGIVSYGTGTVVVNNFGGGSPSPLSNVFFPPLGRGATW